LQTICFRRERRFIPGDVAGERGDETGAGALDPGAIGSYFAWQVWAVSLGKP
jgi:hypothetical protein